MIEKIILDYLNDALEDPVFMERPSPPPARYYLLEKTGSGEADQVFSATLALQSIAPSMFAAASMNEVAKAVMLDADTLDTVTKVDLNSDYNYTDTASKGYRYQAVFDITHY